MAVRVYSLSSRDLPATDMQLLNKLAPGWLSRANHAVHRSKIDEHRCFVLTNVRGGKWLTDTVGLRNRVAIHDGDLETVGMPHARIA
jgi:hypothetical protein